ncbi:MAG TPA: methylated-DNA--[protein]-cysteine S-methyltransferase [Reyranella sp.]|nr:methylated-DNA--[protein]-cysteine S-methyltransferase [Reyranella sp.]
MPIRYFDSPIGRLALEAEGDALIGVRWASANERSRDEGSSAVLREATRQLDRYFKGRLKRFDLRLEPHGTAFQQNVWKAMRAIPFGRVATYGGIAMKLGSGPRAVGMACGANPLVIVTPCHRVLASGGAIGGYSGGEGLPTKRKLLALEGVVVS